MGWTVLYIAFGIVALWLLGEVLLQYKARLRWRLLAFSGFLGVVLGVLMSSVFVIALGTIAFATGQTFVTLSFRRGFSTGWALGGKPGTSRRRRPGRSAAAPMSPAPPVPPLPDAAPDMTQEMTLGLGPEPGDDTPAGGFEAYAADEIYAEQRPHGPEPVAAGDYAAADPYQQETYDPAASYADPYTVVADAQPWDEYAAAPQHTTTYATDYPYYQETPPGGVWMPHQRETAPQETDGYGYPPPEEHPQQGGYDPSGYYYTDDQRY
ncbi:hypothetical protein [Streptomyces sp. NBC_01803]|uniref:hypothetical protein n=1 Tax=Streptomyces sp. NBC_01803 TaxID=2975946 RepID=UPI002DDB4754|nr:hypothetical protein [Streptomyces sp. NBC_01803]WSA46640.1 hypothetical protein OIE51_22090 [Streptomyces sp. NBC_01803]